MGGDCIITADHGNAEYMLDDKNNIVTAHTKNPVPFILVSEKHKTKNLMNNGSLANVAPTILKLIGIDKPETMEKSLI